MARGNEDDSNRAGAGTATRRGLLSEARGALEQAGVPASTREVEWLLQEAAGLTAVDLVSDPDGRVPSGAAEAFRSFVARRLRREPVQYILGYTEFFGLRIAVNPAVLIPRPETEELVERALARLSGVRDPVVVDAGTGSGCIALAIGTARPDAAVTGFDRSGPALETARENAGTLGIDVEWVRADFRDDSAAERLEERYGSRGVDALVSNPPYVDARERPTLAPEVGNYEPARALYADSADALGPYRDVARLGARVLKSGGSILLEIHEDRGAEVVDVLRAQGFTSIDVEKDLAGRDRIVCARIPSAAS